jgi:ABC-type uncharacterized transport system auxiliary subunit
MTEGSFWTLAASSACIMPMPQALSGCVGSVQFVVIENSCGCPVSAAAPFPDFTFQNATLTGVSADAGVTQASIQEATQTVAHERPRIEVSSPRAFLNWRKGADWSRPSATRYRK